MNLRRRIAFAASGILFRLLMGGDVTQWYSREFKAARLLLDDLSEYLTLSQQSRALIRAVILEFGKGGQGGAGEVLGRILNRLATELRTIEWCAASSYQLQAMSLASNVVEHAHVLGYIGRSESRAKEWTEHGDFERSYPGSVKKAIRGSLEEQGRPADDLQAEWRAYGALCLAKHGNPQALKNYGVEADDTRLILHYGPFVNVATAVQGQFALYQSVRAAAMACYAATAPRYGSESTLPTAAVELLGAINRVQERDMPWITRGPAGPAGESS